MTDEEEASSSSSPTTDASNGFNDDSSRFQNLFDKYNVQQKEIDRLEEQNAEYREKLVRTIRERDLNDELLKNVRDETKNELEELKRKIRDYEIQLKAVQDKASAQEAHFNVVIKDLTGKYNGSVSQLTKKADQAEKDKNEAVIKYATREAEIMRVRSDMQKKEQEVRELKTEKERLEKCQNQENVETLEKTVSSLRVELEKTKSERFDLDNKLKMSDKRVEAAQTSITELKQQCDILRKQMIQMKEERNQLSQENRELLAKSQSQENRLQHESENFSKSSSDMESRLRETLADLTRIKEENRELQLQTDEVNKENLDLLNKLQDLEDRLQLEEEAHERSKEELQRLVNIESQVKKSLERAEKAEKSKLAAEKEKDIAEEEAEECRQQAERMLQITEQLTQRNSQFANETEQEREKNLRLEQELVELKGQFSRLETKLRDKERELGDATCSVDSENTILKEELKSKIEQVRELTQKLADETNAFAVYKRKNGANVKELRNELSALRRQLDSENGDQHSLSIANHSGLPSMSSRSRTSSITSLDRVTSCSQEEHPASTSAASDRRSTEEVAVNSSVQQAMVDKIVQLQRKLARRTEKIEFLEEHVRQCLEELQKKTKIIQHYALREEASLLLPVDASMEQVPVLRKGSSYALMGSMFTTGDKKSLQLVTEINSRLQAVLEDALLKNITLKTSVDSLGNEVARLSRENRLLTLTQSQT